MGGCCVGYCGVAGEGGFVRVGEDLGVREGPSGSVRVREGS